MNKIFQEVPYDIFYAIIDFLDEDKHYKKAEHQQKMQGVFVDLKNMSSIFGVDTNTHILIPAYFAKICWGRNDL